uniref:Uncharacterized protein n=1 Tax=uncultured prokaryote TaxID=198431 RepID=A0A0H5QPM7_9ZZZZ|nr:hypothetical protein [uncultured prokaryote]
MYVAGMAQVSAQVILKTTDNVPANFVTNTYHFRLTEDSSYGVDRHQLSSEEVAPALVGLYDDLSGVLGNLAQTGHRIKFVDVEDPHPQYPYYEHTWGFANPINQAALPHEVCVVSSFEADIESGKNQASRRGRVFLGPISLSQCDNDGRLKATARSTIADAFHDFTGDEDNVGISGWEWCVYSRTLSEFVNVAMGHVDNAFDTQRRRGISATVRTVWTDQ